MSVRLAFDGHGPFAANLDPIERAARCYMLSDAAASRPQPASIRAVRWLRTYAVDPRARDGALTALNELPSLDRRALLFSLYPAGSIKQPKPAKARRLASV